MADGIEAVMERPSRLRNLLAVLLSLIVVWTIAFLAPHQYAKVQERLPTLKVDFDPHRPLFNESKVALLVEDRPLGHLTPLLLHMMSVVPPDWRFVFVGSKESLNRTNSSSTVRLQKARGKLDLRAAPDVGNHGAQERVNRMFTNLTFYEDYLPKVEWLLVFHSDSILCARSERTINDWLEYDWVGAPWTENGKLGGSGGLSLRRVSKIKQVLSFQSREDASDPEDKWFVGRIGTLPNATMPTPDMERKFTVQGVWHETPMGYHVGYNGQFLRSEDVWIMDDRRKKIFEYCPEVKMILEMKANREKCTDQERKEKEKAQRTKADEIRKKVEDKKKAEAERKKEEEKEEGKGDKERNE